MRLLLRFAVSILCFGLALAFPQGSVFAGASILVRCDASGREVVVVESGSGRLLHRVQVETEPGAAALVGTNSILIAEHVPSGRADVAYCAARVKWMDVSSGEVLKEFHLPNGSTAVKGLRISPDGKFAVVTHVIGQFKRPTVHLRVDWMAGNALTLIDLVRSEVFGSVLLDDPRLGAANPWGLDFTSDGKTLVVAHSGTHEVSVVDFPSLIEKIMELPAPVNPASREAAVLSPEALDLGGYTPFFPARRQRVKLPEGDLGPREVAVVGKKAFVTNYFSGTVSVVDLAGPVTNVTTLLTTNGPGRKRQAVLDAMTLEKRGEFYFNDASICFGRMQSCASCHPGDARHDGLNWDLLNDGKGNPKNTKSLLLSFRDA